MKIDMHVHTVHSGDSRSSVKDILDNSMRVGLGGVVVLDHNTLKGAKEALAMKPDIIIIPSMEVSSSEGHILAFNISEEIPRDRSVEETIDLIHAQGGVAAAAHPYRIWSGLGERNVIGRRFDAIETMNARSTKGGNEKAKKLAARLSKPMTGGSDSHEPETIGRAYAMVPDDCSSAEDVLKCILDGRSSVEGSNRTVSGTMRYGTKAISEWIGRGMKRM